MPERARFLRGLVSWVSYRQVAIPYQREARFAGETKSPLLKMIRFAADGVLSFSFVPLLLAVWTFVAILFMGGVQLVSLGIIGEYVGRYYGEVKQGPLYFVRERFSFGDAPRSGRSSERVKD